MLIKRDPTLPFIVVILVQPRLTQADYQWEKPEKKDWRGHLLCMLEAGGEHDLAPHKRTIMDWTREIKSRPQVSEWVGGW